MQGKLFDVNVLLLGVFKKGNTEKKRFACDLK